MTESLSSHAFDALHPFSFETDASGSIIRSGRSLRKMLPEIALGSPWQESFELIQPSASLFDSQLSALVGEVITLAPKRDSRLKLRGQVVCVAADGSRYTFSLLPSLWQASQLRQFGLDITDFEVGTFIFDFLLYSQAQSKAREKAQDARTRLEWDTKIARLLHQVTLDTYSTSDLRGAYRIAIESVCHTLGWEVGHVLVRASPESEHLVSSGIWYVSDEVAYRELRAATEGCVFSDRVGLPAKVRESRSVVWLHDAGSDEVFRRRNTIEKLSGVSAIAFPVVVQDRVEAILEFFTRKNAVQEEISYRFLDLLAIQLGRIVERIETERKELEQLAVLAQSAKMATLGEIAAGVAHEINNPVSTISLVGQIIKRMAQKGGLSKDELEPQLHRLELCVKRIAKIVSELRSFSRDVPQDGFQNISVKTLIEETFDLCHARFAQGNIALRIPDIDPSWVVQCRSSQISQVLLNLLSNSYDAVVGTKAAWIELSITDRGSEVEISVTDSGMGIPDSVVENMMKPFYTTKPLGKGTGLGLSISSNIMTDHRGSLTLDRSSAHTRFVMRLPKRQQSGYGEPLQAVG